MNNESTLNAIAAKVLVVLGYFDYFKYPLTRAQIFQFLSIQLDSEQELQPALLQLCADKHIECFNGYYALRSVETYVQERIEGEARFEALQERIGKTVDRVRKFPFVKFAGLSGSLSKGYAPANADVDLFIITSANRLWICRTLLHLMKKMTFLKDSQHYYCMNYFIDETALLIEEQNFFTAIELSTLKPLIDADDYYTQLLNHNREWLSREIPNFRISPPGGTPKPVPFWGAGLVNSLSSNWLNAQLMRLTDRKWRNKWEKRKFPAEDYPLAFKTRISVSKNHLHNYQKKLLRHLDQLRKDSAQQ
ncbi:hypothetical protein [Rurimicrobium arvi]|uniref:Nucleotidyltransferase domain-containing protein n=1 Tax=Rurimicrobium arvi TaxID=2049916 RepID=A0ABP8MXF3_9BACT